MQKEDQTIVIHKGEVQSFTIVAKEYGKISRSLIRNGCENIDDAMVEIDKSFPNYKKSPLFNTLFPQIFKCELKEAPIKNNVQCCRRLSNYLFQNGWMDTNEAKQVALKKFPNLSLMPNFDALFAKIFDEERDKYIKENPIQAMAMIFSRSNNAFNRKQDAV